MMACMSVVYVSIGTYVLNDTVVSDADMAMRCGGGPSSYKWLH